MTETEQPHAGVSDTVSFRNTDFSVRKNRHELYHSLTIPF
ncbi:hypothetical protein [Azospirillum argentinense]